MGKYCNDRREISLGNPPRRHCAAVDGFFELIDFFLRKHWYSFYWGFRSKNQNKICAKSTLVGRGHRGALVREEALESLAIRGAYSLELGVGREV